MKTETMEKFFNICLIAFVVGIIGLAVMALITSPSTHSPIPGKVVSDTTQVIKVVVHQPDTLYIIIKH
jgi:hypothetical protein